MPKFVTVDIHFSAEERALIDLAAAEMRVDPAVYVKREALRGARRELAEATKRAQTDDPLQSPD
jgi:hypothetical protein